MIVTLVFIYTHLINLNTPINALWLFGVWWTSRDPHECIKTVRFQIDNVDNEGRFLYKIRHSGSWCAMPSSLESIFYCRHFDKRCVPLQSIQLLPLVFFTLWKENSFYNFATHYIQNMYLALSKLHYLIISKSNHYIWKNIFVSNFPFQSF